MHLDNLGDLDNLDELVHLDNLVSPDNLASQDYPGIQDQWVNREEQEAMGYPGKQDYLDNQANRDNQVCLANRAHQEDEVLLDPFHFPMDYQDTQEHLVCQGNWSSQCYREYQVHKGSQLNHRPHLSNHQQPVILATEKNRVLMVTNCQILPIAQNIISVILVVYGIHATAIWVRNMTRTPISV